MSDKKEDLVKKAVGYGLGTAEFLEKLTVDNLKTMNTAFEKKDAELEAAKKAGKTSKKLENVTTVEDLIKHKRVSVAVQEEKKGE